MAAYAIHGKGPQRFGPMAKHADAFRVRGGRCRNWPVPSRTRCRFHGGLSTGLKTPEGKAAVVAAIQEGRQRRIAELAFEGKRIHELSPEAQRIDGPSALGQLPLVDREARVVYCVEVIEHIGRSRAAISRPRPHPRRGVCHNHSQSSFSDHRPRYSPAILSLAPARIARMLRSALGAYVLSTLQSFLITDEPISGAA
jgi:hypothetical protein